jgi:CheY-like chemotaxis protein
MSSLNNFDHGGAMTMAETQPSAAKAGTPMILCIDDELIGLRVRRILLERAGYTVLGALDGTEGIKLFSENPIDAVVLDYAMPGMNGAQVAARLRQMRPEVPILLLSAYLGLPSEVTALVDVYMTKGEGAPMLLKKLHVMLTLTRPQNDH